MKHPTRVPDRVIPGRVQRPVPGSALIMWLQGQLVPALPTLRARPQQFARADQRVP